MSTLNMCAIYCTVATIDIGAWYIGKAKGVHGSMGSLVRTEPYLYCGEKISYNTLMVKVIHNKTILNRVHELYKEIVILNHQAIRDYRRYCLLLHRSLNRPYVFDSNAHRGNRQVLQHSLERLFFHTYLRD